MVHTLCENRAGKSDCVLPAHKQGPRQWRGGGLWGAVSDRRTDEGVVEDTGPDLLFPTFGSWNWNACSLCLVPYSWDQDYVTTCPKHPGSWEQEDISEADREGARDRQSGWRITVLSQGTHPKKAPSGPLQAACFYRWAPGPRGRLIFSSNSSCFPLQKLRKPKSIKSSGWNVENNWTIDILFSHEAERAEDTSKQRGKC